MFGFFIIFVILVFWIASVSNRLKVLESKLRGQQPTPAPEPPKEFLNRPAHKHSEMPATFGQPAAPVSAHEWTPDTSKVSISPAAEPLSAADWLTRIGVLALIFGIGFFIKFAIDQGWISQWMRVIMGFVFGVLLCYLGTLWKQKYVRYSGALTGGGLAVMYFSAYASYAFYNLVAQPVAMVLLVGVSLLGAYFAYSRRSVGMAGLSAVGGYLSPILLYSSQDQHTILFAYLGILAVGAVVSSFYVYSSEVLFLTFLGTVFNYAVWGSIFAEQNVWPAVFFAAFIFLLFTIGSAAAYRQGFAKKTLPQSAGTHLGLFAVLLGIFYSAAVYFVLYFHHHDYLALMGLLGSVGAFLAYALVDRLEVKEVNYCLAFVGSALLALACIWQFSGKTTDFMLVAFGLVLVLAGVALKRAELRTWGLLTLVTMVFAVLFTDYDTKNYVFILNSKFGLVLVETAALWFTGWLYGKTELTAQETQGAEAAHAIGSLLLWFGFTWELVKYYGDTQAMENTRNLMLSLWWIGYGTALMVFGALAKSGTYKKIAMAIYVLAILKVFLYDVLNLETGYKIVSFIVLGAILLIVSYFYQHNKEKISKFLGGSNPEVK